MSDVTAALADMVEEEIKLLEVLCNSRESREQRLSASKATRQYSIRNFFLLTKTRFEICCLV
ncbi:hypothetical protein F442_10124 [Phytophthora nicotianae P10297]|uniref:Uncharacterized protein n=1 Tax=Phytophthora nicotianae P10297 TaxID=1317064 RepID=W2Z6L3_PHYNI|nr:hypothetical protein F442_10124 [Phytophthora nicotianae P10297]